MNNKQSLVIPFLLCMAINMTAQSKTDPTWYTMMQDAKVNYYKAVAAYNDYWKGKKLPPLKELSELNEAAYKNLLKGMTEADIVEYKRILLLNRVFKNWMQESESWVQADGSILSNEERQALLDKQRQELKAIEVKNGKN